MRSFIYFVAIFIISFPNIVYAQDSFTNYGQNKCIWWKAEGSFPESHRAYIENILNQLDIKNFKDAMCAVSGKTYKARIIRILDNCSPIENFDERRFNIYVDESGKVIKTNCG